MFESGKLGVDIVTLVVVVSFTFNSGVMVTSSSMLPPVNLGHQKENRMFKCKHANEAPEPTQTREVRVGR